MNWKLTKDRLPKNYQNEFPGDLLFSDGNRYYIGSINSMQSWKDNELNEFIQNVIYWQELPPAPFVLNGAPSKLNDWQLALPDNNIEVYAFDTKENYKIAYCDKGIWFTRSGNILIDVICWMRLPKAPLMLDAKNQSERSLIVRARKELIPVGTFDQDEQIIKYDLIRRVSLKTEIIEYSFLFEKDTEEPDGWRYERFSTLHFKSK